MSEQKDEITEFGLDPGRLAAAAEQAGQVWKKAPYYDKAEPYIDTQWEKLIIPFIKGVDFSVTMDLAAGHGRNSKKLLPLVQKLHIVDIHSENIEFCRSRFGDDPRIEYHVNDGYSLPFLANEALSLAYTFDAMVHFDSDVVRAYIAEFARVVRPGGHVFCHHSNYSGNPTGDFRAGLAWRNFMTKELFAHYAAKEGFEVVSQRVIDWLGDHSDIDCFSLLKK